jgi:antitoxin component YwqK of YwqJK toxin-antitoxin module
LEEQYLHSYLGNSHTVTHYFDDEDNIEHIIRENFDLKGNVTEHRVYKNGEDLTFFEKYIYSDDGKLLFTFSLDENNVVLTETQYNKNMVTTIDRTNANGILVDEITTQYNAKGHWVKKCTSRNGNLKFIEERAIKYYD